MVFFLFFLTTVAGLAPDRAGLILCLSQGWSAITTLLVGILSDRTQCRWGRRRIWMLCSAPVLAISFLLHWWVPPGSEWVRFSYFLVVALLFQTAGNAFTIPYGALMADLTDDHNEHIRLNGFRFSFSLGGCIGSLVLAQAIAHWIGAPQQQLFGIGLVCAVAVAISVIGCCGGTTEPPISKPAHVPPPELIRTQRSLTKDVKDLLRNQSLVLLTGIYSLSWLALQITPAVLPYFIVHCMNLESTAIAQLVLLIQGTALTSLFLWEFLSRIIGKKRVFWIGTSLWILAALGLVDLHSGQFYLAYGLSILMGLGMATVYLVPLSLLPSVVEQDEYLTGNRREGLIYSILVLAQKAALALGLFLVGQFLAISGFQQAIPGPIQLLQPNSALTMIRLITTFIPVLSLLASLVFMSFFSPRSLLQGNGKLQLQKVGASDASGEF